MKNITFPMGLGQRFTKKDDPYPIIDYEQIEALLESPQARPKENALWFLPSSYSGSWARDYAVQRELGQFWFLTADIDEGSPTQDFLIGCVESALGDVSMLVYSSSSSSAEMMKWRVLVPLCEPLSGHEWAAAQQAYFDRLEQESLILDRALERTGQPIFLPNVPPDKRDESGKPIFYQSRNIKGARYGLS